jgi:hypothetical protein
MFGRSSTKHDERVANEEATDGRHVDDDATARDEAAGTRRNDRAYARDYDRDYDHDYDRGVDPVAAQDARRERFGGLNGGAAFFGWLVAVAVSVLLTGIITAIAAGVGSSTQLSQADARAQAGNIGLAAAVVLVAVLMIGYFCGGYVAGRMSRFSGSSQGLGVWITGLIVSIAMIALGAIFGQQYDIFNRVSLPRLPISTDSLTTAGIIAAIVVLAGTLIASLAGGALGTRYHRRVDRAGWNA